MTATFLLLLVTVLPLCHSIEYCVRPTDDSNRVPFHFGHTCRTLNQYIDDSVHYFTSNTWFRILPGKHEVSAPVIMQHIENVSLEAFNSSAMPLVTFQFSCNCDATECSKCSAFQFQNVTNVNFKGMNVVRYNVKVSKVYGIAMTQTKNMHLSNITVMGGIIIHNTNNTTITCAVIYNTIKYGVLIKGFANRVSIF